MSTPIIGSGIKVELQKTLAAATVPTAATAANPPVLTLTAHGYLNGDVVVIAATAGMMQLDGRACRVANVTANTYELEGVDGTGFSAFVAAGLSVKKVSAWDVSDVVTKWELKEGTPAKIETTTIHDTAQKQVFGMDPILEGSMMFQSAPKAAWVKGMRGFATAKAPSVQRVTMPDASVIICNTYLAGGRGLSIAVNSKSESSAEFTLVNEATFL